MAEFIWMHGCKHCGSTLLLLVSSIDTITNKLLRCSDLLPADQQRILWGAYVQFRHGAVRPLNNPGVDDWLTRFRCGHVLDDICPEFKTQMINGVKGLGAPGGEGRYDD